MILKMASASKPGWMEEGTTEPGKIINNMVLAISKTEMVSKETVNGKKTLESSGLEL